MQVVVHPPNDNNATSKYRVSVGIHYKLARVLGFLDEYEQEAFEQAVAWVLEVPFLYARELGLSDHSSFDVPRHHCERKA